MSVVEEEEECKEQRQTKRSSFSAPPSIHTKSPYEWTANEVSGWIVSLNYAAQSKKFANAMINGSKLFTLNRTMLQNDVKIFDVTARIGILKEIQNLKKQIKEMQKNRVEKFATSHTRKEKEKIKKADEKYDDNPKKRKYIKIRKNNNTSDIGSNYTIQSILEHYDFNTQHQINESQSELTHCSINNDKKKSIFMFVIYDRTSSHFIYLFTKPIDAWNIENVFDFFKNISNHKFILFADEFKRKKINGKKIIKYNRAKLQSDYANYFDAALRKNMLDEINLLKQQMNNATEPKATKKVYHSTRKRTKSEIERDRINRQKMRKAGPRDIGKIKYSGTKYDSSKDKPFLQDTIHPLSKDEKFQKRKEKNPAPKKQTLDEIGSNKHFSGTKYDDSKDAGFLTDRINPLSKDERFQKRKEINPVQKNQTVLEIGKIKNFSGTKYDDSKDAAFLADSIHPLSKDERFQQRKEINPVQRSQTVLQIGKNSDFKSPGWKLEDVVGGDAFLSDDGYYRQRTEFITKDSDASVQQKLGPTQIGKADGYKKPEWSEKVEQELAASGKDGLWAEKIKKENKNYEELAKLSHKAGAVEVGKIKGFDAIDYEMSKDEMMGNFLYERAWYDSSQVTDEFDQGISHMIKSLPSHKLRVMDKVPLPSGVHTKIVWLKRLRELIEGEIKNDTQEIRKEQLDQLDAMLGVLQDKNKKKKKIAQ